MSLDENDGSDMELDSDTSLEGYYDHNGTIITLCNQGSKSSNSPNSDENKDESLDNVKKNVALSSLPQNENGSLQYSNYESELGTKSPINSTMISNMCHAPSHPPFPFNFKGPQLPPWPLPENTVNILPQKSYSPSIPEIKPPQVTQQPSNVFSLKSSVFKSPTRDNVRNEPTPLVKHDKIRFELKSTGFKNKLLTQIDKPSVNTLAKKIFNVNNNDDMMNAYDTNLDKESKNTILMDKSLSLSAKVFDSFHNVNKKDKSDGDKKVVDDNSKGIGGIHVVEVKDSYIENSLGIAEENSIEMKKDLNHHIDDIELVRVNSLIIEKIPFKQQDYNNSMTENYEKNIDQEEQVIDGVIIEKDQITSDDDNNFENSLIIKKGEDQEKNQIDDDNSQIQETNLEIMQKGQDTKEIHQNMEMQLDVVNEPLDFIQDLTGDAAIVNRIDNEIEIQSMNIDNDGNKSMEHPSLSTNMEENKIDLMELDQVYILPEQDHKSNDENINNMGIIEKNGGASSEKKENEIKIDKSSNFQNTSKIKDKGKKSGDTSVKPTNQVVSGETTETEVTSQIAETSHIDHLTDLMTQFTNQINQTSCQTNQYNAQGSQSSQIQQKINNIIQHTSQQVNQETQRQTIQPISHVSQSYNSQVDQLIRNVIQPTQTTIQSVQNTEETISSTNLSNEIIEKYHKLDTILLEFDEVAKKAVNAYNELHRLLPEGTVIKIDPPTTYKWDIITSMLGITEMSRLEKYSVLQDNENEDNLSEEKVYIENEENARDEEASSETEFDDEDIDVPSDDPDDKNFKCRSTILKQPNPKRWHNTRSNRPPSANLRQRIKNDPDSSNISTISITLNSSSKKRQSQTTSKRTLRTRKAEDEEDSNTTISNSQKHLDLDKYYVDGRPRRPANGFSYFCGDMCAKVRNEKLPISGTIAYAAEIWKKMTDEEKRPWLDRGEKSKSEYQELLNKWKEEQEELKTSSIRKRTVSPKVKGGSSSKKPRNDEYK